MDHDLRAARPACGKSSGRKHAMNQRQSQKPVLMAWQKRRSHDNLPTCSLCPEPPTRIERAAGQLGLAGGAGDRVAVSWIGRSWLGRNCVAGNGFSGGPAAVDGRNKRDLWRLLVTGMEWIFPAFSFGRAVDGRGGAIHPCACGGHV